MIEILKIKSLGNNRFEVLLSESGNIKKKIIRRGTHRIETEENLVMSFLMPDDKNDNEFFNMLGSDISFRKELFKRVKAEADKQEK